MLVDVCEELCKCVCVVRRVCCIVVVCIAASVCMRLFVNLSSDEPQHFSPQLSKTWLSWPCFAVCDTWPLSLAIPKSTSMLHSIYAAFKPVPLYLSTSVSHFCSLVFVCLFLAIASLIFCVPLAGVNSEFSNASFSPLCDWQACLPDGCQIAKLLVSSY